MKKNKRVKKILSVLLLLPVLAVSFCPFVYAESSTNTITLNYNDFSLGYYSPSNALLTKLSNGFNQVSVQTSTNAEKMVLAYSMQDFLTVDDVYKISFECYTSSTSRVRILIGGSVTPSLLMPTDNSYVLFDLDTIEVSHSASTPSKFSKSWKMPNINTDNQYLWIEVTNLQSSTGYLAFSWRNFTFFNHSQQLRDDNPNNVLTETHNYETNTITPPDDSQVNDIGDNASADLDTNLDTLLDFDFSDILQSVSNGGQYLKLFFEDTNWQPFYALFSISVVLGLLLFILRS